jgi:multiple sugar transport system permease protein
MAVEAQKQNLPMKRGRLLWGEMRDAYLFLLPWFIGFILFTVGPMLASLYISFTRW